MKKIAWLCVTAWLLIPIFALAQGDFALEDTAILSGMGCSWQQGYEPLIQNDTLTLHLPIVSGSASGRVTARIVVPDGAPSPFTGQGMSGEYTRGDDGIWRVVLRPKLNKLRVNGDYSLIVHIEGKEAAADIPLTLSVRDGRAPDETVRPVVSAVSAQLRVGEAATLMATIENPSKYAKLTGLSLTVTDSAGDVLPALSSVLPLGDLSPGESRQIEVPLLVRSDAAVSLHTLAFSVSYTALSESAVWEESFTLPVTQDIRMELGGVDMATTALQGEMTTITLPVMNMGRGDIVNVMVKLVLPGVTDGQSVLVGTVEPGKTGTAKLSFVPGKAVLGDLQGTLIVTCEDKYGNAQEKQVSVELTVEEAQELAVAAVAQETQEESKAILWALGGACAVLLAALVLQGAILRGRIRRLEEERL